LLKSANLRIELIENDISVRHLEYLRHLLSW